MPEARNKRFLLASKSLWLRELAEILKKGFPAYKVKSKEFSYCSVKLVSMFDDSIKFIMPYYNREIILNSKLS